MEITAHSGARPEHARWQGKIVSRSGREGYLSLEDIDYGRGDGFKGWNCKHDWHMFFEGLSVRAYSDAELERMNNATVTYDGEEMPMYNALQKQRRMERRIRETKNELIMLDEAGKQGEDVAESFREASVRLKKREAALRDFFKQTNLRIDNNRTQVYTAQNSKGFGRSTSQKAVWANKKALTNGGGSGIIKTEKAYRKTTNSGAFSVLSEKMSKKHIRDVADKFSLDISGLTLNIDATEELLNLPFAGEAVPEHIGTITFFPNAFRSEEELIRTIYHESVHVKQFKEYGVKYVQNHMIEFEQQAYAAENEFISCLKKEGKL